MSTELTFVDVARHNSRDDNYIILWDKVYNVTPFLEEHPYVSVTFLPQPVSSPYIVEGKNLLTLNFPSLAFLVTPL